MMPNSPKTPLRNVRVDDDLWGQVKAIAATRGETVSEIIRARLENYVDEHGEDRAAYRQKLLDNGFRIEGDSAYGPDGRGFVLPKEMQ